jgi:hypothetical protein
MRSPGCQNAECHLWQRHARSRVVKQVHWGVAIKLRPPRPVNLLGKGSASCPASHGALSSLFAILDTASGVRNGHSPQTNARPPDLRSTSHLADNRLCAVLAPRLSARFFRLPRKKSLYSPFPSFTLLVFPWGASMPSPKNQIRKGTLTKAFTSSTHSRHLPWKVREDVDAFCIWFP